MLLLMSFQTAFAVVNALDLSGGLALGYFATGCAPGGGSSNMYTYLLGGDVSLSVTMTLVSIIASLGLLFFCL
jgi:solute carrier family 10 (sodium/bile acid cotransporter), member 3/5